MSDRISIRAIAPEVADGTYSVTVTGGVATLVEATPGSGGSTTTTSELLTVDGVTPPENVTNEAADDWLYQG